MYIIITQIRESVKGLKESVEALKLYQDFVTQKVSSQQLHEQPAQIKQKPEVEKP